MSNPRPVRLHATTREPNFQWAVTMGLPALAACSGPEPGPGAWPGVFNVLGVLVLLSALPLCAWLAYRLGVLRAAQLSRTELRAAREALRHAGQLRGGWSWQTDASNRLLAWSAPGEPPTTKCALFEPSPTDDALHARLRAGLAFSHLRLRRSLPLDGSLGWDLRGVPRVDDTGAFAGFVGSARPTDDDDTMRLAACALTPLLAANPLPTLLALHDAHGWTVQQANPAAQALWPGVAPGSAMADVLAHLPAAVGAAVALATQTTAVEIQGWQLSAVGPLPGAALALVLARSTQDPAAAMTGSAQETDSFSFTLSHDLRAPIRVVEGFTRIVKEDYGHVLDRVGNDHLDRVLSAAARMNLMIDALLKLARLSQQPLAHQRVNLSQQAAYVLDDLQRAAPEREVEIDIEPGLTAWGDPTLLRMVLENLLGNAWKYSSRCARAQVLMRTVAHGDKTAFVVRDNGAGFDMRAAERLFGLFQRLHSANDFPGHGVGLASVQRIVHRHGGQIWAEAEPGRGAAFYFTLPN